MQRLFSPWRSKYIESFSMTQNDQGGCVFCSAARDTKDDEHFIVMRGKLAFVIMNLFPYNSGHVLIVPFRHVPHLLDLREDETAELTGLARKMMAAMQEVIHPDGFNMGCNIGRSAGAGIDQHIHIHLVPRWNGDTNFMPVLSDTKLVSEDMKDTLLKLRQILQ
jgi:ATP adenylyltransferase